MPRTLTKNIVATPPNPPEAGTGPRGVLLPFAFTTRVESGEDMALASKATIFRSIVQILHCFVQLATNPDDDSCPSQLVPKTAVICPAINQPTYSQSPNDVPTHEVHFSTIFPDVAGRRELWFSCVNPTPSAGRTTTHPSDRFNALTSA